MADKSPLSTLHSAKLKTCLTGSIIIILSWWLAQWRMNTGSAITCSTFSTLHAACLVFCLLLLSQRSATIAYFLFPAVLGTWYCFDYLYDIATPLLIIDVTELLPTLRIHQHYLRVIYPSTPGNIVLYTLACSILYGLIYAYRQYSPPLLLLNVRATWLIAGGYVATSLLLLPAGLLL